ncbi:hypothetical protein COCCADRAFT_85952 [Bipolaris zeicola 26-R-13]|uniref:Uncharacterized protein n=1 Tax=Cochliobolus carbonum (strain 26-R-13) TaxID=930089 RepID=W6YCS4_COCC2|nr:uncharacterized protein COCCADRAFT_85952 [Bipolaris zeicola 26-R-13]EUC37327.1 hypothetical protein COCCADRAFT_85952 [Bipolaris zeicola 26-R-13]
MCVPALSGLHHEFGEWHRVCCGWCLGHLGLAVAVAALAVGPSVVRPHSATLNTGHLTGSRTVFGRLSSLVAVTTLPETTLSPPNVISSPANQSRLSRIRVRPSPLGLHAANT